MAQAYTPALAVLKATKIKKTREIPVLGQALVSLGQEVEAETAVLSAELPGELAVIRAAERMGFEPEEVVSSLSISVGDVVKKGQLIAQIKTFFGLFTNELHSPVSGVVEFVTETNGHIGIRQAAEPLSVEAYVRGRVLEVEQGKRVVIEAEGALIQGIFGVGGERRGKIYPLELPLDKLVEVQDLESILGDIKGAVLVGGASFSLSALELAARSGVSAVVTASIDAEVLASYVGYEIGVSITGDEDLPFTLIVTEGFGRLPLSERVYKLASELRGQEASVNGATQVRAGAMRPEIIVPARTPIEPQELIDSEAPRSLTVGSRVRVVRVPYFGSIGTVTELPSDPQVIPSGAKVRVLRLKLDDAELEASEGVVVPRANVEIV